MSVADLINRLDDQELAILRAVKEGATDTFEIGEYTTLSNREINYRLDDKEPNLADRGLVRVWPGEGRVTREVNGQLREFDAPKQVHLTEQGRLILNKAPKVDRFQNMGHQELVQHVLALAERVEEHETKISLLQRELRAHRD